MDQDQYVYMVQLLYHNLNGSSYLVIKTFEDGLIWKLHSGF